MLDISKVRSDIARFTADSIHLKSVLRTTWTRPMADEQQRLVRVRRTLTDLFVLFAFSRNKLHVRTAPREWIGDWDVNAYHQKIAMRLMPDYSISAESPEGVRA